MQLDNFSLKKWKLPITAGLALTLFIGVLVWQFSTQETPPQTGADHCPIDTRQIPASSIVLLDVSEPLIGGNAEDLRQRVVEIGEGLPRYGRLSIVDIHDRSEPMISLCRPQRESECDPLTAPKACRGVDARYDSVFVDPIVGKIDAFLAKQKEKSTSPVMEAIKDLSSLTDFRLTPSGGKGLYIVSDMLQHTPGIYTHHRPIGPGEFASLKNHQFYRDHKPDLDGVDIQVFYVLRKKYRAYQTDHHKLFWREYFSASQSQSLDITDINFFGGDLSTGSKIGYGSVDGWNQIEEGASSSPQGAGSEPQSTLAVRSPTRTQPKRQQDSAQQLSVSEELPECPKPNRIHDPNLNLKYPKRNQGSAELKYQLQLNRNGKVASSTLISSKVDRQSHLGRFDKSAQKFLSGIRYQYSESGGDCAPVTSFDILVKFENK